MDRGSLGQVKCQRALRLSTAYSTCPQVWLPQYGMEMVTLSSKYQVVIPRSVRNRLGLRPGMKLQVIEYNGRVEFLPVRKPAELRGLLKGLEPVIEREPDRS